MKKKIRIVDNITRKGRSTPGGIVIETEVETRNLDHFNVQLRTRSQTFKPKKGKGSYTRKQKHKGGF